jgi:hypothetical protein
MAATPPSPRPNPLVRRDAAAQRLKLFATALLLLLVFLYAPGIIARLLGRMEPRRAVPVDQFLVVTSSASLAAAAGGPAPADAKVAPSLLLTAPDGRQSGFDPESGAVQEKLPGTLLRRDRSARTEQTLLSVSAPTTGTYVLEVIGAADTRYSLHVSAQGTSASGLRTSSGRSFHDVPIAPGSIQRYQVAFARQDDGSLKLGAVPTTAPLAERATHRSSRISFDVDGCGGAPPTTVRLSVPGGRSATFERRNVTYGQDVPGLCAPDASGHSRSFVLRDPEDGEYVIEVFADDAPRPYSLHVSFDAASSNYRLQPRSYDCGGTSVPSGQVHRWVLRLRRDAEVPLSLIAEP